MNKVTRIAREEWRSLFRNKVAVFGLLLLFVLTLIAALNAWEYQRSTQAQRMHYQAQANEEFETQPDRHPHRVAHFGHFLFRPLNPLAAFDPGIDAYTGNTLFLEAHRQNSANFGDVRQSSLLLRFGQLTPAFVLQVLAPLLLIFVGHTGVAREKESGTLRVLLAQGIPPRQLVFGKLLALMGFAGLILLPALVALVQIGLNSQAPWIWILVLGLGYTVWLMIWCLMVVLASSLFSKSRDTLLALLAVWAVLVILLPRVVPDVANNLITLPTRFEDGIHVEREYLELGDPHDPDDPKFAEFRDSVLKKYNVTRIEDLPVNFKGLVGMEGERQSSELFNRYATKRYDLQAEQNNTVDLFSILSPTLALRRLSMVATHTDLVTYRRFLEQGEQYRYDLVQGLNKLQADKITYTDDTDPNKENRIAHSNWQKFPEFHYQNAPLAETLKRSAPSAAILIMWLLLLGGATWRAAAGLGRSPE